MDLFHPNNFQLYVSLKDFDNITKQLGVLVG